MCNIDNINSIFCVCVGGLLNDVMNNQYIIYNIITS